MNRNHSNYGFFIDRRGVEVILREMSTGHTSKAFVWRVIGEDHLQTILLKTSLTLRAIAIGVYHAAHCSNVTKNGIKELEYGYG